MKKIFAAATFLLLSALMSSCWQSQQEPEASLGLGLPGEEGVAPAEEVLIEVDAGGGESKVDVFSNSRWKLNYTSRDSLIVPRWYIGAAPAAGQPADTIGSGNNTMTVVVAPNDTPDDNGEFLERETILTIETLDKFITPLSRRVKIVQQPGSYKISLDGSGATKTENGIELTVRPEEGEAVVTVKANGPWRIASKPEEIKAVIEGASCTLAYPENTQPEERRFDIIFSIVPDPEVSTTLTIIQQAVAED